MAWQAWGAKVVLLGLGSVATAIYTKEVLAKLKPGVPRLLAALPVLATYVAAPFIFDAHSELLSRAQSAAMLLWLASFKVLLLCGNRGPLAAAQRQGLTLGQWAALQIWPVLHKEGPSGEVVLCPEQTRAERSRRALARALKRVPENVMIALVGFSTLVAPPVPLFVKTYSAAFGVAAWCCLWSNFAAGLVMWVHGLECSLSWDRPWLQTSCSDFWTRRWNLPAAYTLRTLVFEPLMQHSFVLKPAPTSSATGDSQSCHANGTPSGSPPSYAAAVKGSDAAAASGTPNNQDSPDTISSAPDSEGDGAPHMGGAHGIEEEEEDEARGAAAPAGPVDDAMIKTEPSEGKAGLRKRAAATATGNGEEDTKEGVTSKAEAAGGRPRKPRVSASTRMLALAATFAVSGAMHEILILVCTGWAAAAPRLGLQMCYFMLQVPVSILEGSLIRVMKAKRLMPPSIFCIPVASLTLQVPALYLFWNPIFEAATAAMAQHQKAAAA